MSKKDSAEDKQVQHPRKRLGEILLEEGVITQEQLQEAIAKKEQSGGFLGHALVELGYLTQRSLMSFLVRQCKIPHISLADYEIGSDLLDILPREVCEKYHLLPIDKLGKILTVAMVDPLDIEALEEIRNCCPDLRIKPILCDWEHFGAAYSRLFHNGGESAKPVTASTFGLSERKPESAKSPDKKPAEPDSEAMDAAVEALLGGDQEAEAPADGADKANGKPEGKPAPKRVAAEEPIPAAVAGPTSQELVGAVRESIHDALRETLDAVAKAQGDSAKQPAGLSSEELSRVMRESVEQAMAKATGELVKGLQSAQGGGVQEQRIAELAEAAMRAAQVAEEAVRTAKEAKQSEASKPESAPEPRDNVHSFPGAAARFGAVNEASKPELDALEALDGPGMRMRTDERVRAALESEAPLPGYIFDEFLGGEVNSFTVKLCRAVAAQPGPQFSPLFIYGDVGLGKTHLINAIGNNILSRMPDERVGYVSGSMFARRFEEAHKEGRIDKFRERYCEFDLLIMDDVQFLANRAEAQEELFHIFNALVQEERQLVITADSPPDMLKGLDKRLVSRFCGGVVASVRPPERETRVEILKRIVMMAGGDVPEPILTMVATRIPGDIRRMSGALRKVIAFAKLVGQDITGELVDEILSHLGVEAA